MSRNGRCFSGEKQQDEVIKMGKYFGKLTSHEERLSTSLITPILLPSGECLAVVVYIR